MIYISNHLIHSGSHRNLKRKSRIEVRLKKFRNGFFGKFSTIVEEFSRSLRYTILNPIRKEFFCNELWKYWKVNLERSMEILAKIQNLCLMDKLYLLFSILSLHSLMCVRFLFCRKGEWQSLGEQEKKQQVAQKLESWWLSKATA